MPTQKHRRRPPDGPPASAAASSANSLLQQRSLALPSGTALPRVSLRSVRLHPHLFRKLVDQVDPTARPGDLVSVYTPQGELFGHGLYNPRAEIAVRMLTFGGEVPGPEFWNGHFDRAIQLRRNVLQLDSVTDAYRVIHAEADGLSGLVVDRFGDVLSAEVFSLAMFQRSQAILACLSKLLGTTHTLARVPVQTHGQEGFLAEPIRSPELPEEVVINEFGTKFRVRFADAHKTGFFCDQRENRRRLAEFCAGRTVLDLCCYTGGFALQAKRLGNAAEVTGVDLDEKAIDVARANARMNEQRLNFVHADVFGYMRDMIANGRTFDVVVLDPPKLIRNRRELEAGTRTHLDLNRLAVQLVADGGLLVSCTCSGLLGEAEFLRLVNDAARQAGKPAAREGHFLSGPSRLLQILARTGAASDHPVSGDCPETEYLKAVWMRVVHA
jgi:23S rRNA (cytosine1962-C5)-methyltransferase